jgi:ribosomal protein L7/L12
MPAAYEAADLQRIFGRITDRLRAIESQLAVLSAHAGVPYDQPGEDAPPEVVELARQGKQLEAIKRYRELTNADFDTARDVVTGI